jgi:methionine-rich copper-binding protein CopC
VIGAPTASAHDQLKSTTPDDGARVSGPSVVRLTFGEPVLDAGNGNRIVVVGPSGRVPGTLVVDGAVVSTTFDQPLPAGQYTVTWRVASDDGHPVSGTFRFTSVAGTASPTPGATASATAAADPSPTSATPVTSSSSEHEDEDQAGGPGRVLLLVLIVGAALSAGTIVLAKRRQREAQ